MSRGLQTVLPLVLMVLAGCGGGVTDEALAHRSLSEIADEVAELDVGELEKQARAYQQAIHRQREALERLRAAKEKLDYTERSGPDARRMDDEMRELSRFISRLIQRRQFYVNKLHQRGVSTDEFEQ